MATVAEDDVAQDDEAPPVAEHLDGGVGRAPGPFDGEPATRPMPGLIEWHLGDSFGVQVWSEPDRAGRSSVMLDKTDLDAAATRLSTVGIGHDGPQPGGGARILQLADPDGNRVVLPGA